MKIICSRCKKLIGEQAPYEDRSAIKAKCSDCITEDKKAGIDFKPSPESKDGREVTLDNGIKGRLWAVKRKTEKLSLWDLIVSGKKFFCSNKARVQFQSYLNRLKDDEVDVTFFHSEVFTLDLPQRGRKKKEDELKIKEKKRENIECNCTVKVSKQCAQYMFDKMVVRLNSSIDILKQACFKKLEEMSQKNLNGHNKTV